MTRTPIPESSLVDAISSCRAEENVVAYRKFVAIRSFALTHTNRLVDSGAIDPAQLERSVVAQVAYALQVSPFVAKQKFVIARDLFLGLDHLRALFETGAVCERRVGAVVSACTHLDPTQRAQVDTRLAEHDLPALGLGRLNDLATKTAAEVAPEAFAARCAAAKTDRRVTMRPAADGMVDLKAHLPLVEGVATFAALRNAVNDAAVSPEPQTRTPDYRRLFSSDGVVIGGESRRRALTGLLARLIRTRDGGRCTEPYCDAAIRHTDHIIRWADGGTTCFDNGRGLCAFHNQVRETFGWAVRRDGGTVTTTTPTGHEYRARIGTTAKNPRTQRERSPSDGVPRRVRPPHRP